MDNIRLKLDLLKMQQSCVVKIKDVDCLVIHIRANDLYVSLDSTSVKPTSVYWNVDVLSRKEEGQYGDTHYVKQNLSSDFNEQSTEEAVKQIKDVYFGQGKTFVFEKKTTPVDLNVPTINVDDDLPF
jgi:hypothetical protein